MYFKMSRTSSSQLGEVSATSRQQTDALSLQNLLTSISLLRVLKSSRSKILKIASSTRVSSIAATKMYLAESPTKKPPHWISTCQGFILDIQSMMNMQVQLCYLISSALSYEAVTGIYTAPQSYQCLKPSLRELEIHSVVIRLCNTFDTCATYKIYMALTALHSQRCRLQFSCVLSLRIVFILKRFTYGIWLFYF